MTASTSSLNPEGPFDLLLALVKHDTAKLSQVSLAEVTREYLAKLDGLSHPNPSHLGSFVELGARLLHLKSLTLLPSESPDPVSGELDQLSDQLEAYQTIKLYTKHLKQRSGYQTRPRPAHLNKSTQACASMPVNITLAQLTEAMTEVLKRQPVPLPNSSQSPRIISLKAAMGLVQTKLAGGPISLAEVCQPATSRSESIMLFLALLELVKADRVILLVRKNTVFATSKKTNGGSDG